MANGKQASVPAAAGRAVHLSVKASEKGAVSVYGLQRFPVSLYADQWLAILDKADAIRKFITDNRASLKDKPDSGGGPAGATAL